MKKLSLMEVIEGIEDTRRTSFKGIITDKQFKCLLNNSYLDKIVMNWICS